MTIIFNTLYLTGLAGRILYPNIQGDYITSQLAIDYLPTFAAAFMMIGIFGAMMSTTQSIILVIAQAIANDIYVESINPKASGKTIIAITRVSIFVVAAVCLFLTWSNPPEFLSIFLYLGLSGVGSCVAVPLFAAIVWKDATAKGAIASAILGPIVYSLLEMVLNVNLWFSSLLAVIISGAVLVGISLFEKSKEVNSEKVLSDLE